MCNILRINTSKYIPWDGNRLLVQGGQELLVVGWREKMSFLLAPSTLKGKTFITVYKHNTIHTGVIHSSRVGQYYCHCAILGHVISTLQTYFYISIVLYVQYITEYCHTLQSTTVVFIIICTNNYYLNPPIHTNRKGFYIRCYCSY